MEYNSIKIATLNLNGETYWSINKRPRLPQNMFNIQEIKEKLLKLQKDGLAKLLRKSEYDIIAIQELINIFDFRNQIEDVIKENNYELILPSVLREHFTCGFIVKNKYCTFGCSDINVSLDKTQNQNNRFAILNINKEDKEYKIVNMHIDNHKFKVDNYGDIIVGDMNAYSKEQVSNNKKSANVKFLKDIERKGYKRVGNNDDYTWKSNGEEKCLDHIFAKNKLDVKRINKDDEVNYYYSDKGFTDHSLLAIELIF